MTRHSGSSAVVATGATLLLAAVAHHWAEITTIGQISGPMVGLAIDGGLAVALIYGGWRLRRAGLADADERTVAVWTMVGVVAGTGIEAATLGVQRLEGRSMEEPGFHLLVTVGVSALLLFIAGYYATRKRETAQRYESLFDNAFQFTGLLRPDGTIVEANDTALDFGGLESEEAIGEHVADVSWWAHSEAAAERVRDAVSRAANGEFVRYETDVQGNDGVRTIDFSVKPVEDRYGGVKWVVAEGRDITDKRQRREHLQVLHRVLRHNIRNDLTKLRGWTQQTAEASDPDERATSAGRVITVTESWEKLVTDVKDIQQAIEREQTAPVPVGSLVAEVVEARQDAHPAADIELALSEAAAGDVPSITREAVDEAIDNAVESNASGTPTVAVVVADEGAGWLRIDISDDGPGMPDAEAAVLETGEETAMRHGDGLGVWKIRMVVKQSGGRIAVDASDGGTSLSLLLPGR